MRSGKAFLILMAIAAFGAVAALAETQPIPPTPQADLDCKLTHATIDVPTFRALPAAVEIAFWHALKPNARDGGEIAFRGAMFNPTDVLAPGNPIMRRFIRAGQAGDKWFVWYEHGGIAYTKILTVFALDPSGKAHVIAHLQYLNENPCALTDAILSGRKPPTGLISDWW